MQKYKEYLNGSNLIVKLQAKHDLLKQTLGEGESEFDFPRVREEGGRKPRVW